MIRDVGSSEDSLPLDIHAKIGELRERFEDACQAEESPRLKEYLAEIEEAHPPALFRELLRLELDYLAVRGQAADTSDYLKRFPEYHELIRQVVHETRPEATDDREVLPDDLPQFGPYLATRKLGEGGFGVVYLATHEETGHQVAIKVGTELLHEAKTLLSLKHPSIIRVLHVGRDAKNRSYLVMDYMQGGSLRDRIDSEHPMLPDEAVEIAARIAEALHAAHSHPAQIYHRDLKPENVLFDEDGNVCVADFGLALAEAEQGAHRGDISGTVPYQSPEQIRGEADWIDGRSDVWAVGVILYEMLTGHRPFAGQNLREQILQRNPKSPRQTNDRVPEVLESICLKCLEKDARDRYQTADALASALRGQELGVNPYKGLESFEEADADRFFGRQEQIERLKSEFARLYEASLSDRPAPRILPILGPSGCGKSSLVKAGLVPVLRRESLSNRKEPRVAVFRPRTRPLKSLADVLDRFAGGSEEAGVLRSQQFVKAMRQPHDSGHCEGLWWIVDSLPGISDTPLMVVVDQFEELFTESNDEEEREQFIENLLYAASQRDGAFSVVLTLRSDFLAETQRHERLNEIIANHGILIPAMKESELREAITEPARRAGYEFDEAVIDLLVNDSHHREGALPLLQVMLTRIWDGLRQGIEPATIYQQLGGVGGALAKAAESVYEGLSEEEQQIARRVFLGLVELGEGTQDTRRTAEVAQILSHKDDPEAARKVLTRFSAKDSRFITLKQKKKTNREERDATLAELTHEALLEHWQRLRIWIDSSRRDLRFKDRLNDAAERWDELGRPEGSLWRPPELDVLRHRRPALDDDLSQLQKEFVDAAELYDQTLIALETERRETEEQRQRKEVRFLRRTAIVFALLIIGLAGTAYWALGERTRASISRDEAVRRGTVALNRLTIMTARSLAKTKPHEALLSLREIPTNAHFDTATRALNATHEALLSSPILTERRLLGHTNQVGHAAWSPDGERIVTASYDGTARVWNTDGTGEPIVLAGHTDAVWHAAWSPDGKSIVTASKDGTARVWNTDGQGAPIVLRGHADHVRRAAWSPDGKRIVTASYDGTARVWNPDGTGEPIILEGHEDQVWHATWSPNGKRIVTASQDKTARVWNADGSGAPIVLAGHQHTVRSVAWSPDGKRIVTAAWDKTARVWNADGTGEPIILRGDGWNLAVWSPDGKQIVTAANRGSNPAHVWNADGKSKIILAGHTSGVSNAAWSPDGKRIVTASQDFTARVWNADGTGAGIVLTGHAGTLRHAAWSPDGKRIVTASRDHTARVWNVEVTRNPVVLSGHKAEVIHAAWSLNGKQIVTSSEDKTARVWNADGTGDPIVLTGHIGKVWHAAWSPDGKRIVTSSEDKTARVWNADGTGDPIVLIGHAGTLRHAAWSPDCKRIVTTSRDRTARVWNADGTGDPIVLTGHTGKVWHAAWSPDGKRIVTASWDHTARVWNADGTGEPIVLAGHEAYLFYAAWSPDGKRIVTPSWDYTVRVWNADGTGKPTKLLGHTNIVFRAMWSPVDKRIVTTSQDRTARVWNADETGAPIILTGHEEKVCWAAWSPDGKRIVTSSLDHTARLWNADGTGDAIVFPWHADAEYYYYVALSPDGKRLVTGSPDGTARVWTINDWPEMRASLWKRIPDVFTLEERIQYLTETPEEAEAAVAK